MGQKCSRDSARRAVSCGFDGHCLAVLATIFLMLAVVAPVFATPGFRNSASVQVGPAFSSGLLCADGQQSFSPDFSSEAHCIANVPGGFFDVFASGSASPARLGASARIDLTGVTFPNFSPVQADGFGAFSDDLTFSAGSRAVFAFDVGGVGGGQMNDIHGRFELVDPPPGSDEVNQVVTFTEVLTPGQPLAIDFSLATQLFITCPAEIPCNFHKLLDLSHSATLASVQVQDAAGNPLSGVTITSASGFDYGNLGRPPQPVDGPPTVLLIGVATLLLPLARVAHARRARRLRKKEMGRLLLKLELPRDLVRS